MTNGIYLLPSNNRINAFTSISKRGGFITYSDFTRELLLGHRNQSGRGSKRIMVISDFFANHSRHSMVIYPSKRHEWPIVYFDHTSFAGVVMRRYRLVWR